MRQCLLFSFLQKELSKLVNLDLVGNPVVDKTDEYRTEMFQMFPQLLVLDTFDREGNEIFTEDEEEEGEAEGEEEEGEEEYVEEGELDEEQIA